MWNVGFPMAVGALMLGVLLLELGLGKIGFLTKSLGIQFDPEKNRFELSTGPVFGIFLIGATLIIAPIFIDQKLVNKGTFFLEGKVSLEDDIPPTSVSVIACYPLTNVQRNGSFSDVRLYKDEVGNFPSVAFEHKGYYTESVRINKETTRDLGSGLELKEKVRMMKKQETGDSTNP